MNRKLLLAAPLAAALLGLSAAGWTAPATGSDAPAMQSESHGMEGAHEGGSARMGHMMRGGMRGGEMQGGMMGMMGCPMMGGASGENGKVLMQMHGEMMRAMGDIMMKYADKFETPPSSKLP